METPAKTLAPTNRQLAHIAAAQSEIEARSGRVDAIEEE